MQLTAAKKGHFLTGKGAGAQAHLGPYLCTCLLGGGGNSV